MSKYDEFISLNSRAKSFIESSPDRDLRKFKVFADYVSTYSDRVEAGVDISSYMVSCLYKQALRDGYRQPIFQSRDRHGEVLISEVLSKVASGEIYLENPSVLRKWIESNVK